MQDGKVAKEILLYGRYRVSLITQVKPNRSKKVETKTAFLSQAKGLSLNFAASE